MACYHPIPAWQAPGGGEVRLHPPLNTANLELPCGKCLGCRQAHATQWANRCTDEARQFRNNSFLTLTYNDRFIPPEGHLSSRHLQLFLKRLRKKVHRVLASEATTTRSSSGPAPPPHIRDACRTVVSNPRKTLRYFACGEYGDDTGRPHYHLLIFNADFPGDQIGSSKGQPLRVSPIIEDCWTDPRTKEPYGIHTVSTADPGAVAGYIAKYALKHQHQTARGHTDSDGVWKPAPFLRQSKGLGKAWLEKYHSDLVRGYIVNNGKKQPIPRYYKTKLKEVYTDTYERLQHYEQQYRLDNQGDKNTPERRRDSEIIHEQRYKNTKHRS